MQTGPRCARTIDATSVLDLGETIFSTVIGLSFVTSLTVCVALATVVAQEKINETEMHMIQRKLSHPNAARLN